MDHPFAPGAPTYLVANTAVQLLPGAGQAFRLLNLSTAIQHIAWGPTSSVTVTAPTGGSPQTNTLGIPPSAERTITVPNQGLYWIASSSTGFEVTQGDGV